MAAQVGDTVRFLNSTGGGIVRRIENGIAYVDEDGFETPTLLRECVVVAQAQPAPKSAPARGKSFQKPAPTTVIAPQAVTEESAEPVEETPGGDKLNIVLAYEPDNIKRLNDTTFATYLVNDSNYYIYYTYMSRADDADGWTLRNAGMVEPGIQLLLEEITGADLPAMDRIAVQIIAFKEGREFALKSPVAIETQLNTTKFFKLHCFTSNTYFDKEVIALELVKDDVPMRRGIIDSSRIEEGMLKAKKAVDRPKRQPVQKRVKASVQKRDGIIAVDLHSHELIDNTAGLSAADMLNLQIDEFRRIMDENLKNKGQKIVFIHGKGEGVLRQALMKELNHRYKGHQVQDASFREYGFGATQVTI